MRGELNTAKKIVIGKSQQAAECFEVPVLNASFRGSPAGLL
jgi:hypothetical protein